MTQQGSILENTQTQTSKEQFPGAEYGFVPAPFQLEDIKQLEDRVWSCNWSEMGAFKTSTVCWLIPRWAEKLGIENPKVLIITTRSGKGTYMKHVPKQLPDYEMYNLNTNICRIVMGEHSFEVPYNPDYSGKSVFLAHYNVFSRRKARKKKKEVEEVEVEEEEVIDEELEEAFEVSEEERMLAEIIGEIQAPKKKEKKKPLLDELQKTRWDVIILDEAHRIKGRNTGWTKEIKKLKGKIKHVMTGTGFINDPSEIWSLLNFCSKREYASYWRFREKYCAEDIINGYRKIVGVNSETKAEFQQLVRTVGPRRTKREVFKNLPEPIYTPYTVELNSIQRKMYEDIRDELFALDQDGEGLFAPNVLAALVRLRQITSATPKVVADYFDPIREKRVQKIKLVEPSSKLDAIMDIIDGLEWDDERRDQVVVFSNFKDPLEMLKVRLEPQYNINGDQTRPGIPYLELRQADNDKQRYEKWALTFPKKEHQVFMSTLSLGAESISLTSASTCIFIDRSWSPKDNIQAESRVWRPGQKEVANIIHINAEYTVDDRVFQTNETKTGWFTEIFG